jgi:hypothetical protein
MASGDHVQFAFQRMVVHAVVRFTGYVEVHSSIQGLERLVGGSAGDHRAGTVFPRSERQDGWCGATQVFDPLGRSFHLQRGGERSPVPYLFAVVLPERNRLRDSQQLRESGVVSYRWILIQGQVHGIEGQILPDEGGDPTPVHSGQREGLSQKRP